MISLSDTELQIIMDATALIDPRERSAFLQAVAVELSKHELLGPVIVVRDVQH